MPCTKCENNKWRWGERGECKYPTKAACEKAHPGGHHSKDLKDNDDLYKMGVICGISGDKR